MSGTRRFLIVAAVSLLVTGCSSMIFLGTGNNIVEGDSEDGLNQTHVFSKTVSVLGDDGEPIRVVKEVVRGQRYRVAVAMAWQNEGGPGNVDRIWRFVREGEIYGREEGVVDVDRSPFVFEVDGRSTHKPAGRYGYQLYLQERLITRVDVIIVDTPTPAPAQGHQNRGW